MLAVMPYKMRRLRFKMQTEIIPAESSFHNAMTEPMPVVEIFSQGDEIVTGQTVDTNAAWLSEQFVLAGFHVSRHTTVGDRLDELAGLLREVAARADFCVCTGGLGPTADDLTAEAVGLAFDRPLECDPEAERQIEAYFTRAGRDMPRANLKQAMLPGGARRIDNSWGTAPGFALQDDRCHFAFLPGVPFEMKNMFLESVRAQLGLYWNARPLRLVTLRTAGIGESSIQERLESVDFPDNVRLSFRTGPLENQTKLLFQPYVPIERLRAFTKQVAQAIGSPVFGIDGLDEDPGDLLDVIGRGMTRESHRLSVLETLSCGQVASRCAGAHWFIECTVVRDHVQALAKLGLAGPSLLEKSALLEGAASLAQALRRQAASDLAIAQLWDFDQDLLAERSSVVDVYTALATTSAVYTDHCTVGGTRPRKQAVAATRALDLLRRYLQGIL